MPQSYSKKNAYVAFLRKFSINSKKKNKIQFSKFILDISP